ncbi:SMP-30/gluconolactonase/LRE family protein [Massilia sp. TSP1-1-2]|uniref:SMP-30/gluconolactonase/LRE family protein n=1 Tax=unclassified Massilia TaxID=2609279 RepID=UPI003CF37977
MLELMVDVENQLGECVLWCERSERVLWTDILGATLYAHHPATGTTSTWPMPEPLASFALTGNDDRLLLGLASQLAFFDFSTGAVTPICAVEAGLTTRLNDGRCDRQGRFVFGTFNTVQPRAAIGAYYRLGADLQLERLPLPGCAIANSICFSPDGATMYYCNSPDRTIRCCDYDVVTGAIGNERVFAELEGNAGEPDGSCIDADGHLWNAQWGASRVVRYAPDGNIERVVESPALQPSCVAIGGPDGDVLYVTSARVGMSEPALHDGALFSAKLRGVRGLPESRFKL